MYKFNKMTPVWIYQKVLKVGLFNNLFKCLDFILEIKINMLHYFC